LALGTIKGKVNDMFKNILLKWVPRKEQNLCEKKLRRVMKRLKIEDYNFNWDRSSCYIEFQYREIPYKLEHSIVKAKKRGIFLRDGLDCLMELTNSLEDLCRITERGTNDLGTWISGMEKPGQVQETAEYEEELQIRYKSSGNQGHSEYNNVEEYPYPPLEPEPNFRDFEQSQVNRRPRRKRDLFDEVVGRS
jgi:hypothetical protein